MHPVPVQCNILNFQSSAVQLSCALDCTEPYPGLGPFGLRGTLVVMVTVWSRLLTTGSSSGSSCYCCCWYVCWLSQAGRWWFKGFWCRLTMLRMLTRQQHLTLCYRTFSCISTSRLNFQRWSMNQNQHAKCTCTLLPADTDGYWLRLINT